MAGISLLMALLLGGAAFLFYQAAAEVAVGTAWASDVCSTSHLLLVQARQGTLAKLLLAFWASIGFKPGDFMTTGAKRTAWPCRVLTRVHAL